MNNETQKAKDFFYNVEAGIYTPSYYNKPPEKKPVLTLNNVSVLTNENISSVIGAPGIGKSSIIEAICSSLLNINCDSLGFKVSKEVNKIMFIDMERTHDDVYKSMTNIYKRAGINRETDISDKILIQSYRLLETAEQKQKAIEDKLKKYPANLIVCDGLADLVSNINDINESEKLRFWIKDIAYRYKISWFTNIHPNPGSDKPRGHTGSMIYRESENSFLIKKNADGVRTITTDVDFGKNRNSGTIEYSYRWGDNEHMFISCDTPIGTSRKKLRAEDLTNEETIELINKALPEPLNYSHLISRLKDYLPEKVEVKGTNAMKDFVKYLVEQNYIEGISKGQTTIYHIHKTYTQTDLNLK